MIKEAALPLQLGVICWCYKSLAATSVNIPLFQRVIYSLKIWVGQEETRKEPVHLLSLSCFVASNSTKDKVNVTLIYHMHLICINTAEGTDNVTPGTWNQTQSNLKNQPSP